MFPAGAEGEGEGEAEAEGEGEGEGEGAEGATHGAAEGGQDGALPPWIMGSDTDTAAAPPNKSAHCPRP